MLSDKQAIGLNVVAKCYQTFYGGINIAELIDGWQSPEENQSKDYRKKKEGPAQGIIRGDVFDAKRRISSVKKLGNVAGAVEDAFNANGFGIGSIENQVVTKGNHSDAPAKFMT